MQPILGLVSQEKTAVEDPLAELVDRCKEVAELVGQGQEVFAECAYCHGPVPLWEALFTQQIAGLFAHLTCPEEMLREVVGEAGPQPDFDYEGLVAAVEARMERAGPEAQSGSIEVDARDIHLDRP